MTSRHLPRNQLDSALQSWFASKKNGDLFLRNRVVMVRSFFNSPTLLDPRNEWAQIPLTYLIKEANTPCRQLVYAPYKAYTFFTERPCPFRTC
jgi:hypothetical protein